MHRAFLSLIGLLALPVAAPVGAQATLPADMSWHTSPGGESIGTLRRGAEFATGTREDGWTMVTIEGWVASFRLGTRNDTLDRTVIGSGSAPIRAADGPTQRPLGEVVPGTYLKRLAERNGWTRVRRSAWVRTSDLQPAASPPAARTPPPSASSTPPPPAGAGRGGAASANAGAGAGGVAHQAARTTSVRAGPGSGDERATLRTGTTVETLARQGGWARVRIEGWVAESDLMIADSAAGVGLSAADLRTSPAQHKGRIVRWDVEVIAVQRADPLRRGLNAGEEYILARGPGDENAILYLVLPPSLVEEARNIPTLSSVNVTARVRDGNSRPVGVPILEVISLSRNE